MNHIDVSCTGITKTFRRQIFPSVMLQDHILRWRLHRKEQVINALQDISLSVSRGEWIGLYGANGAGKTTLLRILAGLLPPDQGTVSISGTLSCFFGLGVGFHADRSAEENVYLHGLFHGLTPSESRRQIDSIIDFAGLASHRDLPIKCYSTGMTLRLAFAAASHIQSDIYFFDEVLAVGDADFQEKCIAYLRHLKHEGKTAIIVSHSLDQLKKISDRIIFLNAGIITQTTDNSLPSSSTGSTLLHTELADTIF